nr:ATP-binding protein [Acanthopleuribacter pedis]
MGGRRLTGLLPLLLWGLIHATPPKQAPVLRFTALQEKDGLSFGTVNTILQDDQGFLWIGTDDGLNRYDGVGFRIYKYEPNQPGSLSDSFVQSLFQTKAGTLWIGTSGGGLCRYLPERDAFERFQFDPRRNQSLPNDYISAMTEDKAGNLWIATIGGGLAVFDPAAKDFVRVQVDHNQQNGLFSNEIWALAFDAEGHLWIATYDGIGIAPFAEMDAARTGRLFFHHLTRENSALSDNRVRCLTPDPSGAMLIGTFEGGLNEVIPRAISRDAVTLDFHVHRGEARPFSLDTESIRAILPETAHRAWIATDGGGLYLWHRPENHFFRYQQDRTRAHTISSNRALTLARDRSGLIWIGTANGGINRLDLKKSQFAHLGQETEQTLGLSDPFVNAVLHDARKRLWVGTNKGLNVFTPRSPDFRNADLSEVTRLGRRGGENTPNLSHDSIRALAEDASGAVWVGTWGGGLNRVSPDLTEVTTFRYRAQEPATLSNNYIRDLWLDRDGTTLWIATSNGLNRLDIKTTAIQRFKFELKDLNGFGLNRIASIYQAKNGRFWLGGDGGLVAYDPENGKHEVFRHDPLKQGSLSNNRVRPILARGEDELWIGTAGGGLNRFVPSSKTFTTYRAEDGLAGDTVKALLLQDSNSLWISTSGGLSLFHIGAERFTNFTTREGLVDNQFNDLAATRAHDGTFFFGAGEGVTYFHPEHLQFNDQVPNIAVTNILLDGNPLGFSITGKRRKPLIVPPHTKSFSFEFAVLDYTEPDQNTYAYMLEGYEDDWIHLAAQPRINYTNIDPGEYVFRVKGANNHGLWNETGSAIRLQVLAPWWRSTPALFGWAVVSFSTLFLIYTTLSRRRELIHQNALNQAATELEREQRVAERLRQLDKLKDSFLANTSHELRTPLNGIMGIVESLIEGVTGELPPKTKANLSMVLNSAKRLSNLVNDILDYSKLKERTIELNMKPVDLRPVAEVVLLLNRPMAAKKGLVLLNQIPADSPLILADEDRLQQVLHNLIDNAVKYTEAGNIKVSLEIREHNVQVTVKDTGVGMTREQQSRIFASFEQGDQSIERIHGGTGLGLAITKQLVKLHGGVIWAESQEGRGSSFHFTMPQADVERFEPAPTIERAPGDSFNPRLELNDHLVTPVETMDGQAFTILVVDDEPVNLQVLVNLLTLSKYNIVQAADGEEALALLFGDEHTFDLAIIDVMMPRLSGYEVCMRIRERWSDRELPVVLLTARNQVADMAMGFEAGANDYLTKPVSKETLLPRIETHLKIKDMGRDLSQAREEAQAGAFAKESAIFATSILHNIGNVLNSLKVSTQQTQHKLANSKVHRLKLAGAMLAEKEAQLLEFLRDDPKGRMLPNYFMGIGSILADENHFLTKQLDDINKKTELMQEIIEIQQRHAKADRQGLESFNLQEVVGECLRFMGNSFDSRNIILKRRDRADAPLPVKAQRVHSLQIVMNLLKNAMEAMEQTSSVQREIEIDSGHNEDGKMWLSVRDTGVGITEEQMRKLFAHGYTTKKTGHGFGLHYCRDVMASMGGDIRVESAGHQQGACFTLYFSPCPKGLTRIAHKDS